MIKYERLVEIIRDNGAIKDGIITEDDRLQEDLLMNSLSLIMLLNSLEKELHIILNPTVLTEVITVGDLSKKLRKEIEK